MTIIITWLILLATLTLFRKLFLSRLELIQLKFSPFSFLSSFYSLFSYFKSLSK